jgi:hypothetical protein
MIYYFEQQRLELLRQIQMNEFDQWDFEHLTIEFWTLKQNPFWRFCHHYCQN